LKALGVPQLWRGVVAIFLVILAFIGFWPSPVDEPVQGELSAVLELLHSHGIPAWFNYAFVEAAANVVLFVPVGIAATLAFPDKRWWRIAALGLVVSGCMELGQQVFLSSRVASPLDLVTNTAGCVLGIALAQALLRVLKRRQAQRLPGLGPSDNNFELVR
jgi:glycopeptide antibiotics resistance protein